MKTIFLILYPLLLLSARNGAQEQVLPKEGSQLNFRIIGFQFPYQTIDDNCTLQIASGNYTDSLTFRNHIVQSLACNTDRQMAEAPQFGKKYTWRTVTNRNGQITASELHHFSTAKSSRVDNALLRLKVALPAKQGLDMYVLPDAAGVMYDMRGSPVWFLPDIPGIVNVNDAMRDFKITNHGSITFMLLKNGRGDICDVGLDGKLLWRGPNNGKVSGMQSESYHHEFSRLSNGHYMTLGFRGARWPIPGYMPENETSSLTNTPGQQRVQSDVIRDSTGAYYQWMKLSTLIEYDTSGRVVWSWNSEDYLRHSDIADVKLGNGKFKFADVHINSFDFDEKDSVIYLSCRNINRILKIKYPEGTVICSYGLAYSKKHKRTGTPLLCGQHSVRYSGNGYLYLFNNNSLEPGNLPKIEILQEPQPPANELEEIREYQVTPADNGDTIDERVTGSAAAQDNLDYEFTNGGNVIELPNQLMFGSAISHYGGMFIVNRQGESLWRASLQAINPITHGWMGKGSYRASIASRAQLEQLVWNAEERSR